MVRNTDWKFDRVVKETVGNKKSPCNSGSEEGV